MGSKIRELQAETIKNPEFSCDFGMDTNILYENEMYVSVRTNWFYQAKDKGKTVLVGENGYFEIPALGKGNEAYLHKDGVVIAINEPMESDFEGKITHVLECIEEGLLKSPVWGEEMSVEIMRMGTAMQENLQGRNLDG